MKLSRTDYWQWLRHEVDQATGGAFPWANVPTGSWERWYTLGATAADVIAESRQKVAEVHQSPLAWLLGGLVAGAVIALAAVAAMFGEREPPDDFHGLMKP